MERQRKRQTLSRQLRQIIETGPMSRYELAKLSGVDAGQLHRFVAGTGRLTTTTLDRVGAVLKLRFAGDD